MSTPRTKRPFAGAAADPAQRQITSFFNVGAATDLPPQSEPARQLQPELPKMVQSNLLSVGMRVRKSVPEGYKTAGHSAFKLWTDNTTPSEAPKRPSASKGVSRELLPFCGLNSVGGMNSQPAFVDDDETPPLDGVPELSFSQESNDSYVEDTNTRKRLYDDDEVADAAQTWTPNQDWEDQISPRSFAPTANARPLAVPRTRVRNGAVAKGAVTGQENMAVDNDFEDAGFLVYDSDEMEMGS